jgi:spore germination protein GerM
VVTGLSLGGFGIPTDSSPQAINAGAVPFGLLSRTSPPTVPPVTVHNEHTESVDLYFINQGNGRLALVLADIPRPVTIESKLNYLFNGPGSTQAGSPTDVLTSSIPDGTSVISASVSATGVATIDLSGEIDNAFGVQLVEAFAQMVFTVTSSRECQSPPHLEPTTTTTPPGFGAGPCVDKVLFQVDGQPQEVPIADGAATSEPLTRADYVSVS